MRVRPVRSALEKQQLLPCLSRNSRSLVYAATRDNAEIAAKALKAAGTSAAAYHAGLTGAERSRVQDAFMSGTLRAVCATCAFGMGIDRPDVEAVIHVDIPGSLEAYYQEIGRAGRDGREAVATLLWNPTDINLQSFLIERARSDRESRLAPPLNAAEAAWRRQLAYAKLHRMAAYADSTACLRATILDYFGERAVRRLCGACGNCERFGTLVIAIHQHLQQVREIFSRMASSGEWFRRRRMTTALVDALVSRSTRRLPEGCDHSLRDETDGA